MKVGIIVDNEFNCDIRVTKQVKILSQQGFEVFVLCFAFDNKEYRKIEDMQIHRIRIRRGIKNLLFFLINVFPIYEILWKRKIKKFIIESKVDILHVHDLYMSKSAYLGIKLSKRNIPLLLDLHENYPEAIMSYNWTKGGLRSLLAQPKKWKKKEAEYLQYADKLVVLSNPFKDLLCSKFDFLDTDNVVEFPNFIDLNLFESFSIDLSKVRFKKQHPTLFYFGVVAERRGVFLALQVLRNLLLKGRKVTLLIIGPVDKADKRRFESFLRDDLLRKFIVYIPWIEISELPSYMSVCDICLAPFEKNAQHDSGVANKIFQYMFGKKAIIASNCKPQKELLEKFNCGLIFANAKDFEKRVIKLLDDPNLGRTMGQNGYLALKEALNFDQYNKVLLDAYLELLAKKTSTGSAPPATLDWANNDRKD